ncbi:MAG: tyrosine-type recombinase/integrase [Candidatus Pedobacter colombiensis]|uniref:Tyrosine recombinase XerC n=1 Tax=Candidatus Pedobacter colombiensis TaxID=3121371 RepID=A0AAJ5W8P8_9SPHI|nr:tyrosine-type recombinase/integrase [Pedobacter sp.]WEK20077.1 MAG: tyrosine-type recombinase/integrase [Pedobacter sp.]
MTVEQFLTYLQHEKRYSSHTIQSYQTDLLQFEDFIGKTFDMPLAEVKHVHIRDFMVYLMDNKVGENSVGRKLSTLRSFYKFLLRQDLIPASPMALVKAPKVPKKLPVFIDDAKLDLLLDSEEFFDDSFPSVRDRLIIETFFGTGMRLAELLSLKEEDINFYDSTIRVMGKRSKERIIPISKILAEQLKNYVALKTLQKFDNKTLGLIVTNKGAEAYPEFIRRIVQRYLTYVSTQDKKSPHVLRHSYATSLLNRGADLNAIKELLGHASLAATQVYTHNSVERLKTIYKQAHPKA